MPTNRDEIKAICAMPMTGTAKLVAIAIVTFKTLDTNELAAITGESARTVQKARATYLELKDEPREPEFAERGETRESGEPEFAKDANYSSPLAPASHARIETPSGLVITQEVVERSVLEPARDRPTGQTPAYTDLKNAFNGTTETMLAMIEADMGGRCRPNAENWLASTLAAHGHSAVAQAFGVVIEHKARGKVVGKLLPFWSKTAATMKANAKPPQAEQAPKRSLRDALNDAVAREAAHVA